MAQILRCSRYCSPAEQSLIRILRSLGAAAYEHDDVVMGLATLGIPSGLMGYFTRLMKIVRQECPAFTLLASASPFITTDELHLMSSLGHLSRITSSRAACSYREGSVLFQSMRDCTEILFAAGVTLKFRPLQSNLCIE